MKKEYISPELEAIRIQTMQMLAASTSLSLDELLVEDDVKIIPDTTPIEEFFSHDDNFDFGDDDKFEF